MNFDLLSMTHVLITRRIKMLKGFREFVMRGNLIDMAVGIIIGLAFAAIVKSIVDDVIMPPIGLLLGKVDFANMFAVLKEGATAGPYASVAAAKAAGAVVISYGVFINAVINFLIVAFVLYFIVRSASRLKKEAPAAPATKDCPFCYSSINIKATRCPNCTAEIQKA